MWMCCRDCAVDVLQVELHQWDSRCTARGGQRVGDADCRGRAERQDVDGRHGHHTESGAPRAAASPTLKVGGDDQVPEAAEALDKGREPTVVEGSVESERPWLAREAAEDEIARFRDNEHSIPCKTRRECVTQHMIVLIDQEISY